MIDIRPEADKVILVAAPRKGTADARRAEEHLEELARLTDTAGADVVGRLIQHVRAPDPGSYIGAGKLRELEGLVQDAEASLVIFDEELSPAQGKTLEKALGVRIMDRAELILDIFATRARSKEAKLEVELAQLEYLLPRLARMWVHLSRIRGGIGLRGPGETQLETDRRMIRRKISRIKGQLEKVARHRGVLRGGRRPIPTVALVGYTNAGKSSLLKALTGADTLIEDRLFATLDTKTREMHLGQGTRVRLIDTATHADIVLHIIDASHADWADQVDVVDEVLADLDLAGQVVHVFNKMDLVDDPDALADRLGTHYDCSVFVSAVNDDVDALREKLKALGSGE